jgi:hypothetical protein
LEECERDWRFEWIKSGSMFVEMGFSIVIEVSGILLSDFIL